MAARAAPDEPRLCLYCEGEFTPTRSDQLYCNPLHRAAAARMRRRLRVKSHRGDTTYAVFRLALKEGGLLSDLDLVGFSTKRVRQRAIEEVSGTLSVEPTEQFVAIPMRSLVPYFADGEKVSEVPGFQIE